MEQGADAEPHVFASVQILAGFEAEHTSPLIFFLVSLPTRKPVKRSGRTNRQQRTAK
jgi:hypothetical protein